MARVAVVGAGIAGLTAAYRLQQYGFESFVFEARERVGGVIRSEREAGFLVEHGPNSVQSSCETLETLIEELGLADEHISASDAARMRYIVRDGRPMAVPTSPVKLFTSELFGTRSKLRALREPFVRPADPAVEESVADFVRRRLGPEFLDFGIEPFVAGVFAGDPELLSVRHAFPSLYQMEQTSGSIIKAQFDNRRRAAAGAPHPMFSFRGGLECLPAALERYLDDVQCAAVVQRLKQDGTVWTVHVEGRQPARFDAVVFAAPLHALDHIEHPAGPDLTPLTSVLYAPLSVVALGFRREHVGHPLDGFGMLVPRIEDDFQILGTLFTSSIFPDRAPDGHVLLTSFIGGMRNPALAETPRTEAVEVVLRDLRRLLDTSGAPVLRKRIVWPHSIPQYHVGYGTALEAMDRLEQTWPGWFMAGNYRGGVSVAATVGSGADAARRCAAYLDV